MSNWQTCTRKPSSEWRGRTMDFGRPICALMVSLPRTSSPMAWALGLGFSWGYEASQGALIHLCFIIIRKGLKVLMSVRSM